jgi:outer membrane protein
MKYSPIALVFATSLFSLSALSHQQGDWIARVGATNVSTDGKGDVFAGDSDTTLDAEVGNNTQLGLNLALMLSDHLAIEVLAATPFEHDIQLSNGADFATVKHLPPTLSALYYFTASDTAFQPYIGAGINYTVFFDESLSSTAIDALNANDLGLDDSWGFAVQTGFDYAFDDHWMLNASVRYIDIETTASFNLGEVASSVDVAIDPIVSSITVGYRF